MQGSLGRLGTSHLANSDAEPCRSMKNDAHLGLCACVCVCVSTSVSKTQIQQVLISKKKSLKVLRSM